MYINCTDIYTIFTCYLFQLYSLKLFDTSSFQVLKLKVSTVRWIKYYIPSFRSRYIISSILLFFMNKSKFLRIMKLFQKYIFLNNISNRYIKTNDMKTIIYIRIIIIKTKNKKMTNYNVCLIC